MEEYTAGEPSAVKQDKKNLLISSKDPHLSHLFGDEPKTPASMPSGEVSSQSVMEDSGQLHDEDSTEPEYRLFDEQSYVPDLSPASQMVLENNASSSRNTATSSRPSTSKNTRRQATRSNGSAKIKPFPCKVPGCKKSFTKFETLQKHIEKLHSNDINNNAPIAAQKVPETERVKLRPESGTPTEDMARTVQQVYASAEQPADYSKPTSIPSTTNASGCFKGPSASSGLDVNPAQVGTAETGAGFVEGGSANLFNTSLPAQGTSQNVLQNQQANTGTQQAGQNFLPHQSSMALQQIAMSVQMRSSQFSTPQQTMSTIAASGVPEMSTKQQFNPMHGPITGVRAQLRKSLSSNGKLENVSTMSREWPRVQIPVGGSLDSGLGQNFMQMRMQTQPNSDPTNIENAPLLKNLLATSKPARRTSSSGDGPFVQENGLIPNNSSYPTMVNSWGPEHHSQDDLRSPILAAKRNEFQYHRSMSEVQKMEQSPNPNPSPLHSPTYANTPQFTLPPHTQTTPLPQSNEQHFFPDDILVNNNNNQQMVDESNENLNEMLIESESLVQDLIDEAEANSNQSQVQQQQQLLSYTDAGQTIDPSGQVVVQPQAMNSSGQVAVQGRVTPPPAYNLDPNSAVMNAELIQADGSNASAQMYMMQNQVKTEPQSPMIVSPMAQRSFFGNQPNPITVHPTSNMQPLASPTTPHHQLPMQPTMQPQTPVGEAQWQYPISGQNQSYGSVPQSPVTPVPPINMGQMSGQPSQDGIQNMNYIPHSRQTQAGNSKGARVRKSSGGARKNPDGTLSCAICGHSFRSVPALNGHMRVHSSSTDKKSKDERQRKASGSSSGGNESRTPQSLSSPTTPTFNKINPPASMYQNTAAYNSVTVPAYSNPSGLYNPALSTMEGGTVVPISQNVNPRDAALVHRINPQAAGLYPYALPHAGPMQPHDALLAAADLFARSEPDFTPFIRSPGSGREDFSRNGAELVQVPDLQHFLEPQQGSAAKNELQAAYRNAPPTSVILVPHPQNPTVPSYLVRQSEHIQVSSAPLVPFVTVPLQGQAISGTRQSFVCSPPQELNQANPPPLENIQYLQQPLLQQPSNRSTPLADFADIAVLHDQGQLFTNNQMLGHLGVGQNLQQEDVQQIQQQTASRQRERIPVPDSSTNVGILGSVTRDLAWTPESQQQSTMAKIDASEAQLREDDFIQSSMAHIRKSAEQRGNPQNPSDPFIFPVTVPVHCSRDEATAVTTTLHNLLRQSHNDVFSNNMTSFHDDPMVQESINVANPSTILPNSMMGGNPSGFRSFRQRHHSEGSILKKTWQPEMPCKDDLDPFLKMDVSGFGNTVPKMSMEPINSIFSLTERPKTLMVSTGSKRKVETPPQKQDYDIKKLKTEALPDYPTFTLPAPESTKVDEVKKEVWTVPKQAPPNRQRHRRHSADSRLPYRSGTLFSRSAYLQSMQMAAKGPGRPSLGSGDSREKRRPPPLIIPPSVNALGSNFYHNSSLYISQLHHRRRPSGDSGSSCGNEKIPPYTPPPMLSPVRFGTGLYHNTPGTPSLKPLFRQTSITGDLAIIPTIPEEDVEDDLIRSADPKINIGAEYQAVLPSPCPRWKLDREAHKAELVWKPTAEIETDNSTQSRHVEEYLKLACSAAVPHGGCNKDFALHLLHENKGDILASVRQLLHPKVTVPFDHWMASYEYIGSVRWSLKERQTFERAMMQYHKDFYQISKMIGTKKTADCVDYYYHTIKRRKRRIQRPRRFRRDSDESDVRTPFSPLSNDLEAPHSDENDFLQDHVPVGRVPEMPIQIPVPVQEEERKTSEVVRRSPTATAFIRAPPQVSRVVSAISQPTPPSVIGFSSTAVAQRIPQIHSYAKQPIQTPQHQATPPPTQARNFPQQPLTCKVLNCNQIFPTMQMFIQHQQTHKPLKPYFERLNQASPSPASSPGSVASADQEPQFQCPRCGKTFSKVKSRNAHMKTHGKLAQEKRRQKEEEARRKLEEAAAWRNRAQQQQPQRHHVVISPGKTRELIQFQTVASPLTKPPGM